MKNLFLKLLSIFLILLFCFSPLGAIGLDQGDNITHISDNDGTDFKDVNDTIDVDDVDDVDIEVESVNETDDLKELGNDVKSKRASINETNSSKNLKLKELKLEMEVDDTTYGEGAVVKVWIKNSDFGIVYNPKIKVVQDKYGRVYAKDYFTKGCNEIKLRDDLPIGTYTVTYEFKETDYWKGKTVSDTFTVKKRSSDLKASIEDVYVGEKPVVKVSSAEDLEEDVIISSPQLTKDYQAHLSNGEAACTIDEDLPAGNYSCSLSYPGDSTHDSQDLTIDFAVNKHNPNLTVQVDDVIENDPFTVKIHADESLNGEVTYLIKSLGGDPIPITRSVKIVDGVANSTLETHLNPGTYTVAAYFYGDDYFKESTVFSTFKVDKKV